VKRVTVNARQLHHSAVASYMRVQTGQVRKRNQTAVHDTTGSAEGCKAGAQGRSEKQTLGGGRRAACQGRKVGAGERSLQPVTTALRAVQRSGEGCRVRQKAGKGSRALEKR
jgi:hypothetical protein